MDKFENRCGSCKHFKRGVWHEFLGGGKQKGGKCKVLLAILSLTNSELMWTNKQFGLHIMESFGCYCYCSRNKSKKTIVKKIVCPRCKGDFKNVFPAFPHKKMLETSIETLREDFKCDMCNGSGKVSEEVLSWIEDGKMLKDKRIAKKIVLRLAAKQLNMDIALLSKMERGCVKPDMSIQY